VTVLLGLFEYFERQWITSTAPALWNVHGNDVWRKNNHCEGWHSLEKRLATLKGRYDSGQMSAIEYITGVSHNLAERKNN